MYVLIVVDIFRLHVAGPWSPAVLGVARESMHEFFRTPNFNDTSGRESSGKLMDLQWILELTGSCHCHGAEQLDGATCGLGTHWDIVSLGVLYQIPPAICYINIRTCGQL